MRKRFAAVIVVGLILGIGFIAFAWRSPIAPIARPAAEGFDQRLVKRGAELAAVGNCNTCHTAPGGHSFAGGLGIPTPFGTIYSTNITPDDATGIGRWSEDAFRRALREGVDREGRHLYPAFPYDHFTLITDADVKALYAYFMTRQPVQATAPANHLVFPLNVRLIVAGWKLLFFRQGPYQPDHAQSEAWNRGAYLVEGLAHCGACHTPRNKLGAEKDDRFAGGEAEGWTAYALNQASPAPVPWDAEALRSYLRNGWHTDHGIARGPMAEVVDNLASVPESDVLAIAAYMAGIVGEPSKERRRAAQALIARVRAAGPGAKPTSAESQSTSLSGAPQASDPQTPASGAKIYQAACATCHEGGRPLPFGGINLALSTGPNGPNARNVINVVLWGLPPAEGERSPIMPGFTGALNDQQLAVLLSYVRSEFSDRPPWTDIEKDIRDARTGRRPVIAHPAHGTDPAQPATSQPEAQE
jgi:mono/diheme cytochrome c family protein